MTKPGDRHAMPTSWMPNPSLPNAGRAVAAPDPVRVFLDKSSFRGRWRATATSGEPGSFFTIILGAELPGAFREALGGEDFAAVWAADLVGLRLAGRCVVVVEALVFGVPETAAEVRGTEGDEAGAAAVPVVVDELLPAGANSA